MRAVARAHQNRNLAEFERALKDYREGKANHDVNQLLVSNSFRAVVRPHYTIPPGSVI
jgi:hypothetical protein